jgi:hypothetical protein
LADLTFSGKVFHLQTLKINPNFETPKEDHPEFGILPIEQFFHPPYHLPNPSVHQKITKLPFEFTSRNKINVQFFP